VASPTAPRICVCVWGGGTEFCGAVLVKKEGKKRYVKCVRTTKFMFQSKPIREHDLRLYVTALYSAVQLLLQDNDEVINLLVGSFDQQVDKIY
jgi:hypothetical protein